MTLRQFASSPSADICIDDAKSVIGNPAELFHLVLAYIKAVALYKSLYP